MKDGPLWFTIVTQEERAFYHHLEVGHFPSDYIFSSVMWHSREVADFSKSRVVKLTCLIFQVQYDGDYPLDIYDPPNSI